MKVKIFNDIKQEVLSCKKCDLGCDKPNGLDPHVMGQGNLDANIMFIAEAPGKEETVNKRPLDPGGTAGKKFKSILNYLDLTREDVFITNTVLCRPENNADPLPYQILKCENYLKRQINLVKPKLIVTFGRFAAQSMIGYCKITRDHGKIFYSEKFDTNIYPLYHTAYVSAYANASRRKEFKRDIAVLKSIIKKGF